MRWGAALAGLTLLGALGAWALSLRSEISPVSRPGLDSFSVGQVQRGARLATVGDCVVCHTSEGGKPFAGGRALATPFGTLYATNLTPDEPTGMGNWSLDAFRRAMREGVARNGQHLYPALAAPSSAASTRTPCPVCVPMHSASHTVRPSLHQLFVAWRMFLGPPVSWRTMT